MCFVYFETRRFTVRQWKHDDGTALWKTMSDSQVLIGFTGLNPYLPKQPEIEWQFGVPFWGIGYASEIGKAAIRPTFASTNIDAIYGIVNPQNKASMRVLEKIGLTCLGLQDFRGEPDMFYRIERSRLPQ